MQKKVAKATTSSHAVVEGKKGKEELDVFLSWHLAQKGEKMVFLSFVRAAAFITCPRVCSVPRPAYFAKREDYTEDGY